MAVMKLGRAMAEDVAKETGRARAIESSYLNQLFRTGYIKKKRELRRVYFFIEINQSDCKPNHSTGGDGGRDFHESDNNHRSAQIEH
jgi:hypothetical protein